MRVLGVSGSPIPNSNTDRAVKIVLAAIGAKQTEFIKLRDCTVSPCNACLACVETNRCVINDDGVALAEKAYKADILVIAGYTSYASLDARTKAFLERLYPLRHRHGLMAGKPGAAIVTSAVPTGRQGLPPAGDNGLAAIRDYMREEGLRYVGGVSLRGNAPCIRCGDAGQCQRSALKLSLGPEATPASVGINTLEDDPQAMAALHRLGEALVTTYFGG